MPQRDTCIVFLTHIWDEVLARRFERLRRESAAHADCFLVLQEDDPEVVARWKAQLESIGAADALFTFNALELPRQLGFRYFGSERIMGNAHFPLLSFLRSHPGYAYFWQVEGDVEYRGRWGEFFEAYRETDAVLLAAHFHRFQDWPDWFWWPSLTPPADVQLPRENMYKAFMAVVRFSRAALESVERAHRQGWLGHFEAIVPTILLMEGRRLEDLNVRKTCYVGAFQDPVALLPLQSTVRCRPYVSLQEFAHRGQGPLLFHPVKERWVFDGEKVMIMPPGGG
ncbi:DUF3405 domain-containing protein [Ramlibacter sp. PS4R-6]|uniref:DUF3405 domain-containing protein n=1 Tax=Ramlibacter sp. PS4R-6 TaxID=3133438 RepID=UPI0030B67AFF